MMQRLLRVKGMLLAALIAATASACGSPETAAGNDEAKAAPAQSEPAPKSQAEVAPEPANDSTAPVVEAAVEETPNTDGAPRIQVDNEKSLGEVENTGPVQFTFEIGNEGNAPLEISNVKPSCGCTAVELDSYEIAPGEMATLSAKLDLPGRTGNVSKSISIMSNDPETPTKTVTIRADFVRNIEAEPSQFAFNAMSADESKSITATLRSTKEDLTFNIERIEIIDGSTKSKSEHYTAEFEPVEEGKEYKVTVKTQPPLPMQVALYGDVRIHTDNEKYPQIDIPVRGTALGALLVTPTTLLLPQPQPGLTKFTRNILVRPGMTKEFEVLEVVPPNDTIQTKLTKRENIGYLVEVSEIDPKTDLDGKEIVIKTDVESMKEIRVPIKVMQPPQRQGN